ncbi:MAG: hypothetical protein ACREF8_05950, partial [Chthoniobacterales bacterium]
MALFGFGVFPGTSSASAQGPQQNHKVSVSDRNLVLTLQSQGARVIADYGSFVLLSANDRIANNLKGNPNAQIVDQNNLILLNAGAIDTSTRAAQGERSLKNLRAGKQMRLIQFAGPIRLEWYAALKATGVHIVTYIPHNAYLVYGNPQTLTAVHELAGRPYVQWDGDYDAAARLDLSVSTPSKA